MPKYAAVLTNMYVIPIEANTKEDAQRTVASIPKEELKKYYAGAKVKVSRYRGGDIHV